MYFEVNEVSTSVKIFEEWDDEFRVKSCVYLLVFVNKLMHGVSLQSVITLNLALL